MFKNYKVSFARVGREKILYVLIPYKGCSQRPRCLFCGVQETADPDLKIDRRFGTRMITQVQNSLKKYRPDFVVLYNGGNIMRPAEMYQPAIVVGIPRVMALDNHCRGLEIEIRADDIIRFQKSLLAIKENLAGKILRVRLGIEFLDDELLKRHLKQIKRTEIDRAVKILNKLDIPWNGYLLLGGLDLGREEARKVAIKTGKYMIKRGAFKISVNGLFLTPGLQKSLGRRVYIPDLNDLRQVLRALMTVAKRKSVPVLFKVGFEEEFEEEAKEMIVRFPYVSATHNLKSVIAMLREFNVSQKLAVFKL